jgi:hypothetical protein
MLLLILLEQKRGQMPISVEAGEDVLNKSILGKDLNKMATDLGLSPDEQGSLVVRVQAYLDRAAFSQAIPVKITPYKVFTGYPSLWGSGRLSRLERKRCTKTGFG